MNPGDPSSFCIPKTGITDMSPRSGFHMAAGPGTHVPMLGVKHISG